MHILIQAGKINGRTGITRIDYTGGFTRVDYPGKVGFTRATAAVQIGSEEKSLVERQVQSCEMKISFSAPRLLLEVEDRLALKTPFEFTSQEHAKMMTTIGLSHIGRIPVSNYVADDFDIVRLETYRNRAYQSKFMTVPALKDLERECALSMSRFKKTSNLEEMENICKITASTIRSACISVVRLVMKDAFLSLTWIEEIDENVRPHFQEIMNFRMKAATHFEREKRKIIEKLSKENLLIAMYGENCFPKLYERHKLDIIKSVDELKSYEMAVLMKVIEIAAEGLPRFEGPEEERPMVPAWLPEYRLRHKSIYGPKLQNKEDLSKLIYELSISELEKANLCVCIYKVNLKDLQKFLADMDLYINEDNRNKILLFFKEYDSMVKFFTCMLKKD